MKKIITVSTISLAVLISPSFVLAQGDILGQNSVPGSAEGGGSRQRIEDPSIVEIVDDVPPLIDGDKWGPGAGLNEGGQASGSAIRGIGTASKSLTRVVERSNNPEVGEQVRTMVQSHEEIQVRTKTALKEMSQRNAAVKFLLGPDYKNAGQVRSDVVGLRNDISQLEKIKENSLPTDVEDIDGAIAELKVEANGLETELEEQLSGFSLFGWLSRLLVE